MAARPSRSTCLHSARAAASPGQSRAQSAAGGRSVKFAQPYSRSGPDRPTAAAARARPTWVSGQASARATPRPPCHQGNDEGGGDSDGGSNEDSDEASNEDSNEDGKGADGEDAAEARAGGGRKGLGREGGEPGAGEEQQQRERCRDPVQHPPRALIKALLLLRGPRDLLPAEALQQAPSLVLAVVVHAAVASLRRGDAEVAAQVAQHPPRCGLVVHQERRDEQGDVPLAECAAADRSSGPRSVPHEGAPPRGASPTGATRSGAPAASAAKSAV